MTHLYISLYLTLSLALCEFLYDRTHEHRVGRIFQFNNLTWKLKAPSQSKEIFVMMMWFQFHQMY